MQYLRPFSCGAGCHAGTCDEPAKADVGEALLVYVLDVCAWLARSCFGYDKYVVRLTTVRPSSPNSTRLSVPPLTPPPLLLVPCLFSFATAPVLCCGHGTAGRGRRPRFDRDADHRCSEAGRACFVAGSDWRSRRLPTNSRCVVFLCCGSGAELHAELWDKLPHDPLEMQTRAAVPI